MFLLAYSSGSGGGGTTFPSANLQVHNAFYTAGASTASAAATPQCVQSATGVPLKLAVGGDPGGFATAGATGQSQAAFYFAPLATSVAVSLSTATTSGVVAQPIKFQTSAHAEVSQVSVVGKHRSFNG